MSKSPHCPICSTELDTVQFLLQANEVFSKVGHKVKFACCGTVFYIETDSVGKWFENIKGKPRTPSGHCAQCGKKIDGSKFKIYCDNLCKQTAYYRRNEPVVKRKTSLFLRSERNNKEIT